MKKVISLLVLSLFGTLTSFAQESSDNTPAEPVETSPCISLSHNNTIHFQAVGVMDKVNIAFGHFPNGSSAGAVILQPGKAQSGIVYTGSSQATGSTISISVIKDSIKKLNDKENSVRIVGQVTLSPYELQLAGLNQTHYMSLTDSFKHYGSYPGSQEQNKESVCVTGIGASGALSESYAKFYGLMDDHVYVYLNVNGSQSYIRFKI